MQINIHKITSVAYAAVICLFAVMCCVVSPALAQELRKPTELIELVVKSTYTAKITAAVAKDDKIYVWFDYDNIAKDGGRTWVGFTAQKLQIYERAKLVKEILELKDIPKDESVSLDWSLPGVAWMPAGGADEYDKKITFKSTVKDAMVKLGLSKDEFFLGPFDYKVIWARPVGQDKNGFLYVIAECSKKKDKEVPGEYKWRRFQMLYKVNKEGGVVDSFIYDEAKHIKSAGWMRYPWKWPYEGGAFLGLKGDFYIISWPLEATSKSTKIIVRRWVIK